MTTSAPITMQVERLETVVMELMPCPSYPGYYASKEGRVYCLNPKHGDIARELRMHVHNRSGGLAASTSRSDGTKATTMIHDLVADAFIGPKPDGAIIRHRDETQTNCRPENLYYLDRREFGRERFARLHTCGGLRRGSGNGKLQPEQVREIRRLYAATKKPSRIARRFGISASTVCNIANRITWSHLED